MPRNLWGRLTTGGIIVLIGLLLLLTTTNVIEMRSVWEWIPLLFVLLGVWALVGSQFRNLVGPVMIIAIAGAFFARNVGIITDDAAGTWWPLFVVLFGVLVIISRSRRRQRLELDGYGAAREATAVAVFGSDKRRLTTDQFTGAELVAVFGDAGLDLRDATIRARPAIVEAVSVFGDTEIRVPNDWDVRVETLTIFGEFVDRRPRQGDGRRDHDDPELVVTGVSFFGDVEISD